EILKSAVIAAIHDDDRPVAQSLLLAILGANGPRDADYSVGRLRPGEVDEWDVYVQWFHRRAIALADGFLDQESETAAPVENVSRGVNARAALPDTVFSSEAQESKSQRA